MTMIEYDLLINYLRTILGDSLYCEDGELRIKNKLKYDIYNLLHEIDKDWVSKLLTSLEYQDTID